MKIYIDNTINKGKGLFAKSDIKKGEFIIHIDGEVIKTDNPAGHSEKIQSRWFPITPNKYVLPKSPWKYFNHSCEPNSGIKANRDIVAIQDIKKGEEITIDYSFNNLDNWTMECNCGSNKCRGIISTFDKLNKSDQLKFADYINSYVRERYWNKN